MADENLEQKQDSTLNEDAPQSASSSALAANTAAAAGSSAAEGAGDEAGAGATVGDGAAASGASAGDAGKARVVGIAACMLAALALCAATVAYALGAFGHDDGAASVAEVATASGEEAGGDASTAADAEASLASEASGEASSADAVAPDEAPASESVSDGAAAADADNASAGGSPAPEAPSAGADASQGGGQQAEPAPAPQPATVTVSVYIDSSRAATVNGRYPSCMASTTVTLSQGATVYDALCATGVGVSGSSYYVSAINGLAEKLSGYPNSGWMYSVNGVFPQYACGRYVLQGGENIRWAYTLDLGKDL